MPGGTAWIRGKIRARWVGERRRRASNEIETTRGDHGIDATARETRRDSIDKVSVSSVASTFQGDKRSRSSSRSSRRKVDGALRDTEETNATHPLVSEDPPVENSVSDRATERQNSESLSTHESNDDGSGHERAALREYLATYLTVSKRLDTIAGKKGALESSAIDTDESAKTLKDLRSAQLVAAEEQFEEQLDVKINEAGLDTIDSTEVDSGDEDAETTMSTSAGQPDSSHLELQGRTGARKRHSLRTTRASAPKKLRVSTSMIGTNQVNQELSTTTTSSSSVTDQAHDTDNLALPDRLQQSPSVQSNVSEISSENASSGLQDAVLSVSTKGFVPGEVVPELQDSGSQPNKMDLTSRSTERLRRHRSPSLDSLSSELSELSSNFSMSSAESQDSVSSTGSNTIRHLETLTRYEDEEERQKLVARALRLCRTWKDSWHAMDRRVQANLRKRERNRMIRAQQAAVASGKRRR